MIGVDLAESLGNVFGFIGVVGTALTAAALTLFKTGIGRRARDQYEMRWRQPNRQRHATALQEQMQIGLAPIRDDVEQMRCENAEQHAQVAADMQELSRRQTRVEDHLINRATGRTS